MHDCDAYRRAIRAACDETGNKLDDLHSKLVVGAEFVGLSRTYLQNLEPYWVTLATEAATDPDKVVLLNDALDFLNALDTQILAQAAAVQPTVDSLRATVASAATFASTTAVMCDIMPVANAVSIDCTPMPVAIESAQAPLCERLDKLYQALGDMCRAVVEALYATQAAPEQTALFAMRQALDHFFAILASDGDVRKSKYWSCKPGDKPAQVWRLERIRYAAFTHIKDQTRAETLAASAKQVQHVYDKLHDLHMRGGLEQTSARLAIASGQRILSEWADALGL